MYNSQSKKETKWGTCVDCFQIIVRRLDVSLIVELNILHSITMGFLRWDRSQRISAIKQRKYRLQRFYHIQNKKRMRRQLSLVDNEIKNGKYKIGIKQNKLNHTV